ncbi:ABC transporter permease [Mycobacterium sp. AMU20-3851]|uniref:ABC transporter permease n=1 Tax=Mycobacterium sp. AMU20-3851 TaxID=3122055 RepID=UPI0037542CA1
MSKTLDQARPVHQPSGSARNTGGMSLKTKRTLMTWGLRYGVITLVLISWQLASGRVMASYLISSPVEVAQSFISGITDGELLRHTAVTLGEIALGYPIGAFIGVCTGFLLGSSPLLARAFQPIVTALFGIPIIALAPLIVVWLGIGYASKVGIVALLVFFLTFFNTYSGLKNMDRQFVDLARLMGADQRTVILKVVLPTITPSIFAGLSIALPQSVIAATVGEFIAASEGLGYMIRRAAGVFDTPTLIVGALVLMLLVLAANAVLSVIERRVLVWKPQKEGN